MKVALCGVGLRLAFVAKVFRDARPDMEFVAHVDPTPAGKPYLDRHGIDIGRQFDDLGEMLDSENFDLLMIGSPNHLHMSNIRDALPRGIKTFIEKPVVTSEEETREVLKLLAEYGHEQLMVGMVLRYSPLYRALIRERDAGLLGRISSIEASELITPAHGAFFMRDWRRYGRYSGGFMLEKCCHDLDLYQGFVGARPRYVASFGGRRTFVPKHAQLESSEVYQRTQSLWEAGEKVFENDGDIVDHQVALIEYDNGVCLNFHTNLHVPDNYRHFTVIGNKAMAEGDFDRNFFRVHDALSGDKIVEESYEFTDPLGHYGAEEKMIEDVLAHVESAVPLPVSVVDALQAGITALKLDEARTGRSVVDLGETWQELDDIYSPS